MSISIDGTEIGAIAEVAAIFGSVIGTLIICLIVYLLVRPPRHVRLRRKAERRGELRSERDEAEAEELWRLADRMESRLEVLERALADEIDRPALGRRRDNELQPTRTGHGRDSEGEVE